MKKLIAVILILFCVIGLAGCDAERNEEMKDFVGVVLNIGNDNTSYLVKVTDSGSSNLMIGDKVIVLAVDGDNAEYAVDDHIKVTFNDAAEESTAVSMADKMIPVVFSIDKIETSIG